MTYTKRSEKKPSTVQSLIAGATGGATEVLVNQPCGI